MRIRITIIAALAAMLALTGCSSFWQASSNHGARNGASSSLVDYLYPDGQKPPAPADTIPHLSVPLRVGIAFVPARFGTGTISEATRIELLDGVKQAFVEHEFIEHIEVIPESYLRAGNGVKGMQQVARLYGVDVMALVSYDQVSTSEDNTASFLYWTIVGAYVIKGTENEIQTFVDTAVFDVDTARLLFRAPGTDKSRKRSTAVEAGEAVRKTVDVSFAAAVGDMTDNLALELEVFRERVKEEPQFAQVSYKEGWGGGSVGWLTLVLLVVAACRGRAVPARFAAGRRSHRAWRRSVAVRGRAVPARFAAGRRSYKGPLHVFELVKRVQRFARRHRIGIERIDGVL
jgi:rhombotail lipoprotein